MHRGFYMSFLTLVLIMCLNACESQRDNHDNETSIQQVTAEAFTPNSTNEFTANVLATDISSDQPSSVVQDTTLTTASDIAPKSTAMLKEKVETDSADSSVIPKNAFPVFMREVCIGYVSPEVWLNVEQVPFASDDESRDSSIEKDKVQPHWFNIKDDDDFFVYSENGFEKIVEFDEKNSVYGSAYYNNPDTAIAYFDLPADPDENFGQFIILASDHDAMPRPTKIEKFDDRYVYSADIDGKGTNIEITYFIRNTKDYTECYGEKIAKNGVVIFEEMSSEDPWEISILSMTLFFIDVDGDGIMEVAEFVNGPAGYDTIWSLVDDNKSLVLDTGC